jgi:hypothetical protein
MPFSLYDFRDLDLMLKIADEGDNEGWVETRELARALGVAEEDSSSGVAIRLSWMRRYGMLEFDEEHRCWRLSVGGERVVNAKLRAAKAKAIDAIPDEQLVDVMAHVTTRYRLGDPVMATMLRREFAYGTAPQSHVRNGKRKRR